MYLSGSSSEYMVVADSRMKSDADLDRSNPKRTHVLEFWKLGRHALGRAFERTTRIALCDAGEKPSNAEMGLRRAELVDYLRRVKPARLFVIPTADAAMQGEQTQLRGTHCWQALHAPDTLDAMRGTRWQWEGIEVVALFPIAKRIKELQRWAMAQWLMARAMPTLRPEITKVCITPSAQMVRCLEAMAGKPLAVDLEFIPSTSIVTAIGLSDGEYAVSIPGDAYTPRNARNSEPGLADYTHGAAVLASLCRLLRSNVVKLAHNFTADIPRLEARSIEVGGTVHDTFAAHAIALPELRHGLQHAAASMLPVPPWKSLYKPSRLARGITRDDAEYWTADGRGLRAYNALDAYFTLRLARAVMPHVGVTL